MRSGWLLVFCLVPIGCLSIAPPPVIRWFRPPLPPLPAVAAVSPGAPVVIDLQRVEAAVAYDLDFVWRVDAVELRIDSGNRWVEPPARLLEGALRQALFGSGRCAPGRGSGSAELAARVVGFDCVGGRQPGVAVEIEVRYGGRMVRLREEVRGAGGDAGACARAMGEALGKVAVRVVDWVVGG